MKYYTLAIFDLEIIGWGKDVSLAPDLLSDKCQKPAGNNRTVRTFQ